MWDTMEFIPKHLCALFLIFVNNLILFFINYKFKVVVSFVCVCVVFFFFFGAVCCSLFLGRITLTSLEV